MRHNLPVGTEEFHVVRLGGDNYDFRLVPGQCVRYPPLQRDSLAATANTVGEKGEQAA